jgi:hypothetical protein
MMPPLTPRRLLYAVLALHLFLVLVRPINDPDIWWHLRTGQYIFQTHRIPRTDIFSYTALGKDWVAHEWLSQAVMYAIYSLSGWAGLIIFSSIVTAAIFIYVARHCEAPVQFILLAVVISQSAALVVLRDPRPRLATLFFGAVFFIALRNYVHKNDRRLWLLPLLTILWVNLHAGYPLGLAFLLLAIIALLLNGEGRRVPHLATVFALCLIAVTINPHGLRMFSYPFETQFSFVQMSVITEWNAPDFRDRETLPFLFLLLAIIFVLGLSKKRASWFDLLFLGSACFLSLRSKRHVSSLSLISIPILAEHLWHSISPTTYGKRVAAERNSRQNFLPALILILVVTAVHLPAVLQTVKNPINLSEKPVAAVRFLQAANLPDNLFSTYVWNDYLIWNAPERKVFIDGRPDMYGDKFLADYIRLYAQGENWEAIFDRFGVSTVMIEPTTPLASLIKENSAWSEVYRDQQSVIFTKR